MILAAAAGGVLADRLPGVVDPVRPAPVPAASVAALEPPAGAGTSACGSEPYARSAPGPTRRPDPRILPGRNTVAQLPAPISIAAGRR